jgi:dienelactone hydrolase
LAAAGAASAALAGAVIYSRLDTSGFFDVVSQLTASSTSWQQDPANDPGLLKMLNSMSAQLTQPDSTDPVRWQRWQQQLRTTLGRQLYQLEPLQAGPRKAPESQMMRDELSGTIRHREYRLKVSEDFYLPAILLTPAAATARLPAVVVIPGHVRAGESGLQQLTQEVDSYHNSAGLRLAEAGFAVLAIELRGFGQLGPPAHPEHRLVAYNALLAGSFYKSLIAGDVRTAVDFLANQDSVDSSRMGIAGASLGGEIAVAYAGLDQRLAAISFHAYGGGSGRFKPLTGSAEKQPHYCHLIPGSSRWMRREDVFALLAPRPTLGVRGSSQPFSQPEFGASLQQAWQLAGAADDVELLVAAGGHEFFPPEAIAFFSRQLDGETE